jgi:hypothetical protein
MKKLFLTTAFILLLGLFVNPKAMYATCQCPTDIPPTDVEWISEGSTTITIYDDNGRSCTFEVYYCWRLIGGYPSPAPAAIEVFICDYDQIEPCNPNFTLSVFGINDRLLYYIIANNPDDLDWIGPPCPITVPNYAGYLFGCYDGNNPCGSSVYCVHKYKVCYTNGVRTVTEDGWAQIGDCVDPCTDVCPGQ